MVTVAENEVKGRLDELLTAAEGGQTVAITKNGKVVVQMAAVPPVPNGEYDDEARTRRLTAMLDSIDEESYQKSMSEWIRSVEEMREEFRKEGCKVTRETILGIIREMRGR